MNQILNTKSEKNKNNNKKKNWFEFQLAFSISIVVISIFCTFFYLYDLKKEENFSNNLINNYNIYELYNTTKDSSNKENSNGLFRNY
jgi:hypothetical protein